MQLSEHFSRAELEASQVATRAGIDNTIPDNLLPQATAFCSSVLEPVRALVNSHLNRNDADPQPRDYPLTVSSGYRCIALNRELKSKDTSQHISMEACDIQQARIAPFDLACIIRGSGMPFDQLILEFGGWVHISYRPMGVGNRQQCLTIRRNREKKVEVAVGIVEREA